MSYNPFSLWREQHGYTYKQCAMKLGVSMTYYQRLNDGMIPHPTNELLQKLYEEGGDRPAVTFEAYDRWIHEELKTVKFPVIGLTKDTTEYEWMVYRELLCSINGIEDSTLAAARLLKINPAILSKWEAFNMKNIPSGILERIEVYGNQ